MDSSSAVYQDPNNMNTNNQLLSPAVKYLMMLLLATPVQFRVGRRYCMSTYHGLIHGCTLGMGFLVALGTSAAYLYSTFVFAYQRIVDMNRFDDGSNEDPVMKLTPTLETGAWLTTFVTLGKHLEIFRGVCKG